METLTFTQITAEELKSVIREELHTFFSCHRETNSQEPPDEIAGIELAMQLTGLSKPTIYSLVCERKIPHSKRGKRLYFSRQELIEWIKAGKRKTQAEIKTETAKI